jgi:hypothetical protein
MERSRDRDKSAFWRWGFCVLVVLAFLRAL